MKQSLWDAINRVKSEDLAPPVDLTNETPLEKAKRMEQEMLLQRNKYLRENGGLPPSDLPQQPGKASYVPSSVRMTIPTNSPLGMGGIQELGNSIPVERGKTVKLTDDLTQSFKKSTTESLYKDAEMQRKHLQMAMGGIFKPKTWQENALNKQAVDEAIARGEQGGILPVRDVQDVMGYNKGDPEFEPQYDENGQPVIKEFTDAAGNIQRTIVPDRSKPIEEFSGQYDPEHPYQQQKSAIGEIENLLRQKQLSNKSRNEINFSPLMALADQWTRGGGNLLKAYQPPRDTSNDLISGLSSILKSKAELNKEVMDAEKLLKMGQSTDSLNKLIAQKYAMDIGQQKNDWNRRQDFMAVDRVKNSLRNNPVVKAMNGVRTGLATLQSAESNPELLHEAQLIIRQAIMQGSGGQSIGSERAKMLMNNIGLVGKTWEEFLTNDVVPLEKDDKVRKHFVNLAKIAYGSMQDNVIRTISPSIAGLGSILERNPDLKEDMDNYMNELTNSMALGSEPLGNKYKKESKSAAPAPAPAPAPAEKEAPKRIEPNMGDFFKMLQDHPELLK